MNDRLSQEQFEVVVAKISAEPEETREALIAELDKYVNENVESQDEAMVEPLSERLTELISDTLREDAVRQELSKMTPQQFLEEQLKSPEIEAQLIGLATDLKKLLKRTWFDLAYLMKKTEWKSIPETLQRLNMLKLKGKLLAKMDGKIEKYSIVLTNQDKIIAIRAQIVVYQTHIDNLEKDIERINAEDAQESLISGHEDISAESQEGNLQETGEREG